VASYIILLGPGRWCRSTVRESGTAINQLRVRKPGPRRFIIKWNVDIDGVPNPLLRCEISVHRCDQNKDQRTCDTRKLRTMVDPLGAAAALQYLRYCDTCVPARPERSSSHHDASASCKASGFPASTSEDGSSTVFSIGAGSGVSTESLLVKSSSGEAEALSPLPFKRR